MLLFFINFEKVLTLKIFDVILTASNKTLENLTKGGQMKNDNCKV
mgnify:CR=1